MFSATRVLLGSGRLLQRDQPAEAGEVCMEGLFFPSERKIETERHSALDIELWQIWIMAAMVFFIVELATPGFFTAAIGVGCLAAALAHRMGWGIEMQITALSTVTIVVFLTLRPLFLKYLYSDTGIATNTEALIGKEGYVLEKIDPIAHSGRIIVGGEDWRAASIDDGIIEERASVEVVSIDGTRLILRAISKIEEI